MGKRRKFFEDGVLFEETLVAGFVVVVSIFGLAIGLPWGLYILTKTLTDIWQ